MTKKRRNFLGKQVVLLKREHRDLGFDLHRHKTLRETQLILSQTKQELMFARFLGWLDIPFERQKGIILGSRVVVVDFCIDKTIIEIDGDDHNKKVQAARDAIRDIALQELGYRVIRITNKQLDAMLGHEVEKFILWCLEPAEPEDTSERDFTFYCRSHY